MEVNRKRIKKTQEDIFKTIIWRTGQVKEEIIKLILILDGEMKRSQIQQQLKLKHRETFLDNYLNPAIKQKYVELTFPDVPKHPKQKYRLTNKGLKLKREIMDK